MPAKGLVNCALCVDRSPLPLKFFLYVLAGFFLFAVQPFKLGDRVAVSYSSPAVGGGPPNSAWFEGIAEKTDLRCDPLQVPTLLWQQLLACRTYYQLADSILPLCQLSSIPAPFWAAP